MEFILSLIAMVVAVFALKRAGVARENHEEIISRIMLLEQEVNLLRRGPAPEAVPSPVKTTVEEPPVLKSDSLQPPILPTETFEPQPMVPEQQEIAPGVFGEPNMDPVPPTIQEFENEMETPTAAQKTEASTLETLLAGKTKSALPTKPQAFAPAEKASFEMRLGTYWMVRAGIVMLLTGLAFFANYAYHEFIPRLGVAGKIALLYLASGLLLGAGAWWQRSKGRESLKNYAQVLFAGGLAAVYFTTYAAHHIAPLRVIESAVVDGTLLLAWAGVIAWIADRRKSEVMALFAVGLAFYSSVITRVGDFTLYSNLVLTITAVVFLLRNRWVSLSFGALATSYAGYAFWRFLHEDGWRWAQPDEGLQFGAAFLAAYWLIFTVATFLSRCEKLSGPNRAAFLTLNNGAFFGLFILTMIQVRTGGFWKLSLGYGTVLLALAALAKKRLPGEPLTTNAYLTQGLLLLTLGLITKFSGLQLALVLGVEGVLLFIAGIQRKSVVLKTFAYLAAFLATGWCVINLKPFDSSGLRVGIATGVLMMVNAYCAHREGYKNDTQPLQPEPSAFTVLAFIAWFAATWFNTDAAQLPLILAVEAAVFTFSIYLLRIREVALLGQSFLVFAQIAWLIHFLNHTPPWWNPLLLIVLTIGLSHWWQRQTCIAMSRIAYNVYSTVFSLAAIGVVLAWLPSLMGAPGWLALSSLLAVAVTLYGVTTRSWALAICAQIFLVFSILEFFNQVWRGKPDWFFPLAPMAALVLLSTATKGWFTRMPDSDVKVRQPLLDVARVYRWVALVMSLCWLWQYVPDRQHAGALMAAAVVAFAFSLWRRNRESLFASAVYAVASLMTFWAGENLKMDVYWMNPLAILTLLFVQQILRRAPRGFSLDEKVHSTLIMAAGVSLWRFLTCWVTTDGIFLTMSWAGYALLVFMIGMLLQERYHRWVGLGALAAAVGRVVLVDVWKQETIYRVATFMALGVALLVIGFFYNKYQETIRKWL